MRQDRHAGIGREAGEFLADEGADVRAGIEVGSAQGFRGDGRVDADSGAALDEGLDLGLPLFGSDKSRSSEEREDFLGRGGFAQQFVERAAGGDPLAAFGGKDEESAFLEDAGASAHALDTLVQVLVQGIPGVRGDHDVEGGLDALHGGGADEFATLTVGGDEISCEDAGDVAAFVEGDVEEEGGTCTERDVAEFFPKGVAFADAEGGAGVADVPGPVIAHDGLDVGDAGHDPLRTAAEAGEEVRLDEAGDDAEVGFDAVAVDPGGGAGAGGAEGDAGLVGFGFVVQDAVLGDDLGGKHALELGLRVGAMRAELVEEGDLVALNAVGMEVFQQPRDDAVVGSGAGDVREEDRDPGAGAEGVGQGRRPHGMGERVEEGALFVRQSGAVGGFDDLGAAVREFDIQDALSVRERDLHVPSSG